MQRVRLLLIERPRTNSPFSLALGKKYEVVSAASARQAIAASAAPELLILDSVSLATSGQRMARALRQAFAGIPIIHIAAEAGDSPADVQLVAPVTQRKLSNAIERLLKHRQRRDGHTPDAELLRYGPFELDLHERLLIGQKHETVLTPKLARLIEVFFRSPGVTLDRRHLMQHVWQTDYLGDTRTLDVHIRWFRRAIEVDPAHPAYLKTVRGVGYRLERLP
jgi:DNA-binding response OmpR family regulator